uniref:sugar phosphate isomerase/epimerase family protein n=1 Tax=uncultured Draconibacterium sp. TaxID=1573823 RepID=UPI0032175D82
MNKQITFSEVIIFMLLLTSCSITDSNKKKNIDWKLGVQTYTFHRFTYQETIDKISEMGLKYAEIFYGQKLGEDIDGVMDFNMGEPQQKQVLAYAKSKGVKLIASGVVVCKEEAEWEQLFKFTKNMGIEIITCEPEYKHLKYIDQLANKYKIDVAIHNHPKPSNYWNPEMFLKAVDNLSPRIGACADVGHWKRMGIDPVKGLSQYEGRLKSLHFKDIKKKVEGQTEQHDVIWGTGICNIEGMLRELERQGFDGLFSIEYEHNWDNSVPDIKKCIEVFEEQVKEL